MRRYARIDAGVVAEVIEVPLDADPAELYHPDIVATLVRVPRISSVAAGWSCDSEGRFAPPAPGTAPPLDMAAVVSAHVEAVAQSMGYSSAVSCVGYVNSTVVLWAAEAAAFIAWRDAVWLEVFARKDEAPPATPAEALALLPAWVPPR